MNHAPIALFAYNRPDHVKRTVEALQRNTSAGSSDLHVFSDAARNPAAEEGVALVRDYIRGIDGFRTVEIVERDQNLGLARSIIDGVTRLCNARGRVIVVEDDLLTSPHFLDFMNDGLDFYEKDERVISIHGYSYPVSGDLPDTFFLRGADCWGWATWKRGWDLFEADGRILLEQLATSRLTNRFDFDGAYPYTRMLSDQIAGRNDSWAIRWNASAFLKDKLTLYPGRTLVLNIGNDGSGTHCSTTEDYSGMLSGDPIGIGRIPVQEHAEARNLFARFLRLSRPSLPVRVLRRLAGAIANRRRQMQGAR
jgi:hypothetical protein